MGKESRIVKVGLKQNPRASYTEPVRGQVAENRKC